MAANATLICRVCGDERQISGDAIVSSTEIAVFIAAHSPHRRLVLSIRLGDQSLSADFTPEIIAGNVHQWIGNVLLNHGGAEVCEVTYLPSTPIGAPAWKLTQPDGAMDIQLSAGATHEAIQRLARRQAALTHHRL